MSETLHTVAAGVAGFIVGASAIGAVAYHLIGRMRLELDEARHGWRTEAHLRARDRYERAGVLDHLPASFRPPPLPRRTRREAPGFLRRWFQDRTPQ